MDDTLHHRDLRRKLIQILWKKGIRNQVVLDAIGRVPRHLFTNDDLSAAQQYDDVPLDIGQGQTISQPYTVAFQTELLNLEKKDKVLEIGTGSGYQTAVLFEMGVQIYSIERQKVLYDQTLQRLRELGYSGIHLFYGDGYEGIAEFAPYDKILITAESQTLPEQLLKQLKTGGTLVAPILGRMKRITKITESEITTEDHGPFLFVPMLPGTAGDKSGAAEQ